MKYPRPGDRVRIVLGDWSGRDGVVVHPPSSGPVWGKVFVKIAELPRTRAISPFHLLQTNNVRTIVGRR